MKYNALLQAVQMVCTPEQQEIIDLIVLLNEIQEANKEACQVCNPKMAYTMNQPIFNQMYPIDDVMASAKSVYLAKKAYGEW